jgi:hypothetical protein
MITDNDYLGPDNINSGSTYTKYKIFIWRIEEIYKVLIHELIHFIGFDMELFKSNKPSPHCIMGEDRHNEAYTETFAVIIHTMILSKFLQKDFFKLLNYEINFSIFQCKKIMNHFKINDITNILNTKSCSNPINQKTAVFSYFFIKTSFLLNLKKFLDYLEKKDSDFNELIANSINDIKIINKYEFKENYDTGLFNKLTLRMTALEYN